MCTPGNSEKNTDTAAAAEQCSALIVAAGMSRRMKQFKQLMQIGHATVIEQVVSRFLEAGIRRITVVTGYRADEVEAKLAPYGVSCLRNEAYARTEMFDSVKLGLAHLRGTCSRILFCPGDVPMFSVETLLAELKHAEDQLIFPITSDRIGHPILIDAELILSILAYQGGGGLKGALDATGIRPLRLDARDAGSILDADTPDDFRQLLELERLARGT